ncbi:MAG: sulfatase-like hydrolase/transferase [Candidatus Lokiarchaeota archaeon]|nr:sulfatase-like hydrolase/transferase [Candidatus Lokiarchaeota archaeon]MBD3200821.1 sulfatase-like hydrolase/transferase [Candidatus Lokiarchaeota archaeon]
MSAHKPNIILIILDTLRSDRILSEYDGRELTPTLNSLLKDSIYFENCICNHTWTVPSHISMLTGLYSTQNALFSGERKRLYKGIPFLPEILKSNGYKTLCYSENPWINKKTGLSNGFDVVSNNWKTTTYILQKLKFYRNSILLINIINYFFQIFGKESIIRYLWSQIQFFLEKLLKLITIRLYWRKILLNREDSINKVEKFRNILTKNADNEPIFIMFNIMATHNPYIIPIKYYRLFNLKLKEIKSMKNFFLNPVQYGLITNLFNDPLPENQLLLIEKFYNACVSYTDLILRKILNVIEKTQFPNKTHIIITSDHGEHLGTKSDHYFWNHAVFQSVFEPLIKVPLLLYNNKSKKGMKINDQVQLKDIYYTILDMAGIDSKDNSLIQQISTNKFPEIIYGDHIKDKDNILEICTKFGTDIRKVNLKKVLSDISFLRTNNYKFIKYESNIEELYDLIEDPNEYDNLIKKKTQVANDLRKRLSHLKKIINNKSNLESQITTNEKTVLKNTINKLKWNKI